tara:strand:+ start:394 stop:780 length:387 start_codon:yes stop_codon:yes gene_type:complete
MDVNLRDLENHDLKRRYIDVRRGVNLIEHYDFISMNPEVKDKTTQHLTDITAEINRRHEEGTIDMTPEEIWLAQQGGKSRKSKSRKRSKSQRRSKSRKRSKSQRRSKSRKRSKNNKKRRGGRRKNTLS